MKLSHDDPAGGNKPKGASILVAGRGIVNATEKELVLLRAIYSCEYQDGGQNTPNNPVWVNALKVSFPPTSIGGVMTSAVKKGLAGTDGEACWLTQIGLDLLKEAGK